MPPRDGWKQERREIIVTRGERGGSGNGKKNLSAVLVTLNLLAFAARATCEIMDDLWRLARQKLGPRNQFFSMIAAATTFLIFPSWDEFLQTIAFVKAPSTPP